MCDELYFIILNYNNYIDTAACIKSIYSNDDSRYVVIVVDNNSSDGSGGRLKINFPRAKHIMLKNNNGYAYGNNRGIEYAINNGAKYICIVNNDVIIPSWFVGRTLLVMSERLECDIIGPLICEYKKNAYVQSAGAMMNLFKGNGPLLHNGELADMVNITDDMPDYLSGACFVARREVFNRIGLLPEFYFLFYEETDWFFRARREKINFFCDSRLRVFHKGSASIEKVKGLSFYYMRRNKVIFERRIANKIQFIFFIIWEFFHCCACLIKYRKYRLSFKPFVDGLLFDKCK